MAHEDESWRRVEQPKRYRMKQMWNVVQLIILLVGCVAAFAFAISVG